MSLRILIVTDVYPPLIGGVELQMQMLAKKLQKRRHTVAIVTVWQEGVPEWQDDEGISVYRLKGLALRVPWFASDPYRRHHPPVPDPGTVWELRQVIRCFQPDLIHAYGWITYSCAVALVGTKIPLLLSVREYGYTCALRTMMYQGQEPCTGPTLPKCLNCAMTYYGVPKGLAAAVGIFSGRQLLRLKTSGIHSVSTHMQRVIRRELFTKQREMPGARYNRLPDVVIPSFHGDADDSTGSNDSDIQAYLNQLPVEPFILFVGALRLVKGLEPLLAAYGQLIAPPPLVLIGVPSADTPATFPANVIVLHTFPHRAVMAAWDRALFGVAPSIWPEPFGSVIHEAMSRGKAVIGTLSGGQSDMIVEGSTGLLVPPNDVEALAAAMQRLLDDTKLRDQMGRAGRERAALFTADVVVPRFEQLYQQLLTNSKG